MLSDEISIHEKLWVVDWVVFHRERINVGGKFITHINIHLHSVVKMFRLIVEIIKHIVGKVRNSI